MAVRTVNGGSAPMKPYGIVISKGTYPLGVYFSSYYGGYQLSNVIPHMVTPLATLNQVVGFVPVFPCEATECRLGQYGADDSAFMLPVFAEDQLVNWGDYKNDYNSWLFDVPASSDFGDLKYFLDKDVNGTWVEQVELVDNTYGYYYPIGSICNKNYYTGYNILWNKVLSILGEGIYRFRVSMSSGANTNSINHLKITEMTNGAQIKLTTTGYGLICPVFICNLALTKDQNMQNLVVYINNYQNATYPDPLFLATWNSGTSQIDLEGLLGQNCACSRVLYNISVTNYSTPFTGGSRSYVSYGCWASPPFCLKTWDCWAVDLTTRFDASYKGGVIGNVEKAKAGQTFSFCCTGPLIAYPDKTSLFRFRFVGWAFHVYLPITFTFTMGYGYDLLPPITFLAGTLNYVMAQQLTTAINNYQATLGTAQFSAYYNPATQYCEITNLFGENISVNVMCDPMVGNAVNWSMDKFVSYIYTTNGTNYGSIGEFKGGTAVDLAYYNASKPITWKDAIRVGGEFGYEETDYERKSIKYQTGVVNKVRDEAILKHTWKSSSLPFWFHERFKVYGLMADKLLVSDYNMNNSDYNLKLYSVQGESSYNPKYKGFPRESQVECEFKPAIQNLKRSRCC